MPTQPITPERLRAIRDRWEHTTRGHWTRDLSCFDVYLAAPDGAILDTLFEASGEDHEENADFVAHAHQDIPDLLDAYEALLIADYLR